MNNSSGNDAQEQQQQEQPTPVQAFVGQTAIPSMTAFGYGSVLSQEALMNMIRHGQGGMPAGLAMTPGAAGFPPQQQFPQGQAAGGVDANGQSASVASNVQPPQMPPNAMPPMGGYPGMFDSSQMQGMTGFGFHMAGQAGGFMDPSGGMFLPGMQQTAHCADDQNAGNAAMSQANAALGQAQANTMSSSAALAQGMAGMNPAAMAGAPGMMNPMAMGDPNMLLRLMSQPQAAGGMFGGVPGQAGAQAGMFGLGAGLSGAAGITAASYLNMAQQAGIGTGAADLQQSMMPGMMGTAAGSGAVLNPFARPGKPQKQRKSKNKPKRPLSAYNIFFKDERARILSGIPDEDKKGKRVKKEGDNGEENDDKVKEGDDDAEKKDDGDGANEGDDGGSKGNEEGVHKDGNGNKAAGKKRKRVPHGKIGFESLAKIIGRRWKELPPEELEDYKKRAEEDMKRYRKEMEGYLQKQREGLEQSREHLESMVDDETKKRYFGDGEQQG